MGRVFGVAWSKYENKNAKNKQQLLKQLKVVFGKPKSYLL